MLNYQHHTIPPTKYTPNVEWRISEEGISLLLAGSTEMENVVEWYEPVFTWLEHALTQTFRDIPFRLTLALNYVNTSSSKMLLELLDRLREEYEGTERSVYAEYIVEVGDEDIADAACELFSEWKSDHFTIGWKN